MENKSFSPAFIDSFLYLLSLSLLAGLVYLAGEGSLNRFAFSGGSYSTTKKVEKVLTSKPSRKLKIPLVLSGLLFGAGLYSLFFRVTTKIKLNPMNFRFDSGVLVSESECIDMVKIDDVSLKRYPTDRLLGISRVVLYSKDKTMPVLKLPPLRSKDAEDLVGFINEHSANSMVELVKKRESSGGAMPPIGSLIDDQED